MKPRVHAFRSSAMRDSHAKCVRIYRANGSRRVISWGFSANPAMAPSLLRRSKGSGRNQPFTRGIMKKTQVAAVKLCPALADGGGLDCTEARLLAVADWLTVSFRPVIRSSSDISPEASAEFLCAPRRYLFSVASGVSPDATARNFLGVRNKKHLVRKRSKVL